MKSQPAGVLAKGVGLDLPLYTQSHAATVGSGMLLRSMFEPPRRSLRKVLYRFTFRLVPGDRLAVVGQNGSGKSTLLRVLVGAYPISRGSLTVSGDIQALLNLNLGFNPDATVVENIMLRGVAMGMRPAKIAGVVDEVLDFAELHRKAGDRLRTLSSGQRMRLGFALATAVQHQILVMDEWIGTGDASFVAKARKRLQSRVDSAEIVVLASHNMKLLQKVCNKGLHVEGGRQAAFGKAKDVIDSYSRSILERPVQPVRNNNKLVG